MNTYEYTYTYKPRLREYTFHYHEYNLAPPAPLAGQIARGKTGDGSVNTFSKTMYGPQSWDFTLEGWATANGKFDGAQFYIAASAPAWSNSKGMVRITDVIRCA